VYPTDIESVWLIIADFNGDGHIDLATANVVSTVSILLGNSDGTFGSTVNYPTGIQPVFITSGDFNGDDNVDLATIQDSDNSISILFGNGDGTFALPVNYSSTYFPLYIYSADFNGDGHIDLATANNGDGTSVSILLNNGDGTFASPIDYTTTYNLGGMTIGDFNGDHHIDVTTAVYGASNVSILLNNGNGTLGLPIDRSLDIYLGNDVFIGYYPLYINTTDFNGDGKIDIASANSDGTVSILLGYGYDIPEVYPIGGEDPSALAVADFNNDGHIDISTINANYSYDTATSTAYYSTTLNIMFGHGDGTFSTPSVKNYLTSTTFLYDNPVAITVADFNVDGNIDLAIASNGGGDYVSNVIILFGYGDGTFSDF
jgi:hypothetical protein